MSCRSLRARSKTDSRVEFIRIHRVVAALDRMRRDSPNSAGAFEREILNDPNMSPSSKVLAHWVIYITNRRKRATGLWRAQTEPVKRLVESYARADVRDDLAVQRKCDEWERAKPRPRGLPVDLESIRRTLSILLGYNKDIVAFMTNWISEEDTDFVSRMAFALYELSYGLVGTLVKSAPDRRKGREKLKGDMMRTRGLLADREEFEYCYGAWGDKRWHKRTWAALRDYKKHKPLLDVFLSGISSEVARRVWMSDFLDQLELPGDSWNSHFIDNCIDPPAKQESLTGPGPKVVRVLWEKAGRTSGCYPEQFDVSYDLAPRMCENELCDVCPFGPAGAKAICTADEEKLCTVALAACGYRARCRGASNCLVRDSASGACRKGLTTGE